jgi:hypothetical protein
MSKTFGGLPKGGGVTTIGGQTRLELDGSQGRRGPVFEPPAKSQRKLRSDQAKVMYETLIAQGKTEEARALRQGQQAASQGYRQRADDAQHLVNRGLARSVDGTPLRPGSPLPKVIEGPLQNRPAPRGEAYAFTSIDGTTYLFPKAMGKQNDPDSMWKASITNSLNVMLAAMRELLIGGDALSVFDAFGVRVEMNGNVLFPVPRELRGLRPQYELTPEADAEASAFSQHLADPTFATASFGDPVDVGTRAGVDDSFPDEMFHETEYEDEPHLGPYADRAPAQTAHPVERLTEALAGVNADQLEAALSMLSPEQRAALGIVEASGPVDPGTYGDPEVEDEG